MKRIFGKVECPVAIYQLFGNGHAERSNMTLEEAMKHWQEMTSLGGGDCTLPDEKIELYVGQVVLRSRLTRLWWKIKKIFSI